MDVRESGGSTGFVDEPGDRVSVECPTVLAGQQQRMLGRDVPGAVGLDEVDQLWVQGKVAVLVEFADRNVEPGSGADLDDGVCAEAGELADAESGAQQDLDGDADQESFVVLGGAEKPGGGGVVEGLGQRVVLLGRSPGNIGTRAGACSQPHSSIRTKNIRSVPSRCARVAGDNRGLFCPGRLANQGL